MESVYVYTVMCFKSVLHKRRAGFTGSPYCQALYEANPAQLSTIWLISNPKLIFLLADLVARRGAVGPHTARLLALPLQSKMSTVFISVSSPAKSSSK